MLASGISQGSGAWWPGVLFRGPTWLTARLRMSSDLRLLILSDSSNSSPSTHLVVLGIELDSLDQTARLPAEKLIALQELIQSWRTRRWCNRRQLESLIGHLHHAAKVVWPGRTFLRRMLDLLCCLYLYGYM